MWVRGNLHVGSHRPLSGMAQRAQTRSKQRSPQPQRKPWAVGQPLGHYAPPHLSSTYSGRSPGLPEDACSLSVCVFVVCFGANKITRVLWKLPHGARHGSTLDPPLCGTQRPLQAEVSATRQHALIEDIGFLEGGGDRIRSRNPKIPGAATTVCSRHRRTPIFGTQHVHYNPNYAGKFHVCALAGWGVACRSVRPRPLCSRLAGEMVFRHQIFAHESPCHELHVRG